MPFGVGGIDIFIMIPFVNFLLYFVFPFGIMTSQRTGKAKHRTDTSREVAAMPRTEEASTSTEHGKPQAHGSGKASDGREWGDVKTGREGTAGRKNG